ncbi:hypothetical protein FKM82_005370 [Ascaphus truei]
MIQITFASSWIPQIIHDLNARYHLSCIIFFFCTQITVFINSVALFFVTFHIPSADDIKQHLNFLFLFYSHMRVHYHY